MIKTIPDYVIVIPARYDSVRLPGKSLCDLAGKPLIRHVWEAARNSAASSVVIATDDSRIEECARGFGADVVMTRKDHPSGSDRIAECARARGWDDDQLIVNLQGDEPEMPTACLDQVAQLAADDPGASAATLYWPVRDSSEANDPNAVKVVVSQQGRALYFSRSAIPFPRGYSDYDAAMIEGVSCYRHLGLYCYRNSQLQAYTQANPTPLEQAEKLEQLRILERGGSISIARACEFIPPGIDTPEDLERARQRISAHG